MLGKRKRCPHCQESLTIPVYKKHKSLYFDTKNRKWTAKAQKLYVKGIEEKDQEDDLIISGRLLLHYALAISESCGYAELTKT